MPKSHNFFIGLSGIVEKETKAFSKYGILGRIESENLTNQGTEFTVESNPSDPQSFSPYKFQFLITCYELFQRSNEFIIDGKITFFCDVSKIMFNLEIILIQYSLQLTLVTEVDETSEDASSIMYFSERMSPNLKRMDGFKKMFEKELFTDFKLKAKDGVELKAHKLILAARSPVFEKMFEHDMKEVKEGLVDVLDFDSIVMKEMLRYIYCYEIKGLQNIAHELVYAADKYQLDDLKEVCVEEIISLLSVDNVLDSLEIADLFDKTGNLLRQSLFIIMRQVIGININKTIFMI